MPFTYEVTGKRMEGKEEVVVKYKESFPDIEAICKKFDLTPDALVEMALKAISGRANVSQSNALKADPSAFKTDGDVKSYIKKFRPGKATSKFASVNRLTKLLKQDSLTPEEQEEVKVLMAELKDKAEGN